MRDGYCEAEYRARDFHCTACHRTFSSLHAFDVHWRSFPVSPFRACVDPDTLTRLDGSPRFDRAGERWQLRDPGRAEPPWSKP